MRFLQLEPFNVSNTWLKSELLETRSTWRFKVFSQQGLNNNGDEINQLSYILKSFHASKLHVVFLYLYQSFCYIAQIMSKMIRFSILLHHMDFHNNIYPLSICSNHIVLLILRRRTFNKAQTRSLHTM